MRTSKKRARNRQSLLFTTGDFHSTFTNHSVESTISSGEQRIRGCFVYYLEALDVRRTRTHEEKILANRSREQLRVLRDESDSLTQTIEIDNVARVSVVEYLSLLRRITCNERLHQRRPPRACWSG